MPRKFKPRPFPEISGRTIFAEDVRHEITGQFSIIGVIPGGIALDSFPSTVPRLSAAIEYQQVPEVALKEVRLAAFMPGASEDEHFWEFIISEEDWGTFGPAPVDENPGPYPFSTVRRVTQVVSFANLEVPRPGFIQFRAFRDGEVIGLGGLQVRAVSEAAEAD